jgi:HAE1 family hydrophobic/amphiphilic exporter-1
VFLPISFVGGSTGELFRPFALTVTIALLASLLVSLTIVPVLAYWFLRTPAPAPVVEPPSAVEHVETTSKISTSSITAASRISTSSIAARSITAPSTTAPSRHRHAAASAPTEPDELEHPSRLQTGYLPVIRWTLKHAVATLLLAVFVLVGTAALVPFMKVNFLGSTGQTTFRVIQTLPVGTSLAAQDEASAIVEERLRDTEGVEIVQLSIGGAGGAGGTGAGAFRGGAPSSSAVTYSVTADEDADADRVQEVVREELTTLTDVGDISVASVGGLGSTSNIEVNVTAATDADLEEATDAILAEVRKLDAITESTSNLAASRPYIAVNVNRDAAARAGLSELALGSIVSQSMQPTAIGSIVIDETNLSVYLQSSAPPSTTEELAGAAHPDARRARCRSARWRPLSRWKGRRRSPRRRVSARPPSQRPRPVTTWARPMRRWRRRLRRATCPGPPKRRSVV